MKKNKPLPSILLLRERYEISGNDLVYRTKSKHGGCRYGDIVGSISETQPGVFYRYCGVTIRTGVYERYLVHRITYAVAYGVDPIGMTVDHIDGDTLNNNPSNLRLATGKENTRSRHATRRKSKTGIRGVYIASANNTHPYVASLKVDDKVIHVGSFGSVEEAAKAVSAARKIIYGNFAGRDVLAMKAE